MGHFYTNIIYFRSILYNKNAVMIYSKRRKNLGGGVENAPTESLLCLKDYV